MITRRILMPALALVAGILVADSASAQTVPPPTGPVSVCFTQPPPPADSYLVVFDGGAPESVTLLPGVPSGCPTGTTHAFQLAAAKFTVGNHTIVIRAVNAFGSTDSDPHTVQVGVKPGKPAVLGVVAPAE